MKPDRVAMEYQRIDTTAARQLLPRPGLLLLDVRDHACHVQARLASALHVTRANLDSLLLGTARTRPVLIYCYHGHASQTYAQMFTDFGFAEVYSLDGGFEAWRAACPDLIERRPDLAEWLEQHGFAPARHDAVIANHNTPLMHASRLGDSHIVSSLLQQGSNVNARNADGNNALWHACSNDSLAVINLLLKAGIDIDNQNNQGLTCLMHAALTDKTTIVQKLLAADANATLRTCDGRSALDMCISSECSDLLRVAMQATSPIVKQSSVLLT
ncbi:MAG: ankyrin repeat domain-containing protein [Steroidobacteraceae bacterium]